MVSLTELHLRACRARIARACASEVASARLGEITLRSHQRSAVARLCARLDEHHGCLLADDVGRGKTFIALAVARRWARPLVVVPAALRDTWLVAMRRAHVDLPMLTHEALSRGARPEMEPDGVVVDESHHFRNLATKRYSACADIVARAELLLMSATPIQNSVRDLAVQLALFLGCGALRLSEHALAEHVVRGAGDLADEALPVVAAPQWLDAGVDDAALLHAILALPAPPRARDGGDAGALRAIALVRVWASSHAALAATLTRRRRSASAIEQSLDAGRLPTRAELGAWQGADDSVQLGFAALLAAHEHGADDGVLREAVAIEQEATRALLVRLRRGADVDAARAAALARIADRHAGEKVIAFTEFATTARAYHAALRDRAGVALLTGGDARIASGRVSRRDVLARFAPRAQGCAEPPRRERIEMLICTDVLAEGMNLQDASVVVHLDLPWNPARLSQRVGRLRRPAGADRVSSYLLAPPADAALLLDVESRLRRKLADAARTIGRGLAVVPALTLADAFDALRVDDGLVSLRAEAEARIHGWRRGACDEREPPMPIVAGACGATTGWLAAMADGRLIAAVGCAIGSGAPLLRDAVGAASGRSRPVGAAERRRAIRVLHAHLQAGRDLRLCGVSELTSAVARLAVRYADDLVRRAPRHARASWLSRAAALRALLDAPLSLGMERALAELMAPPARRPADEWLELALRAVTRHRAGQGAQIDGDIVAAMVVFGPAEGDEVTLLAGTAP